MTTAFALAIPHLPDIAPRAASMAKLREALRLPGAVKHYREFTERAPVWLWSDELWRWGVETDATHLIELQDDIEVAPFFWAAVEAYVKERPNDFICLYNGHPATMTLAREGYRWYTTRDGVCGQGWVFPMGALQLFLEWKKTALRPQATENLNEDILMAMWLAATGRRCVHPVVSPIDHIIEVESAYGNDAHPYRRPAVTWKDEGVAGAVAPSDETPHLGGFYKGVPWYCQAWVRGFTEADRKALEADVVPPRYARWFALA